MSDDKRKSNVAVGEDLFISAGSLRRKQSVRATFRLPEHVIQLIGIVAAQLGLKQKTLFDQLVENKDELTKVAEIAQSFVSEYDDRRPKTFVLSRSSLSVLKKVAQQQNVPRDVLVEVSIQRLMPVLNEEQNKQLNRKDILNNMTALLSQGRQFLKMADKKVGKEDISYTLLKSVVDVCEEKVSELKSVVEKGKSVEKFNF